MTVLWALSRFDLYAPGLEQVGLGPGKVLYAQGRKDSEVLALAEDALRDGSLACVIAEVKAADQTATRRLQLAASDGQTPMLLYRRHRSRERSPLAQPSSAMTRWSIAAAPSTTLPHAGIGRGQWTIELVRQRGGNPFPFLSRPAMTRVASLYLPQLPIERLRRLERPSAPRDAAALVPRFCKPSTTTPVPARCRAAADGDPAPAGRKVRLAPPRRRPISTHCYSSATDDARDGAAQRNHRSSLQGHGL
ncbi:ImuA family protein [Novosphingobium resinovorum]